MKGAFIKSASEPKVNPSPPANSGDCGTTFVPDPACFDTRPQIGINPLTGQATATNNPIRLVRQTDRVSNHGVTATPGCVPIL